MMLYKYMIVLTIFVSSMAFSSEEDLFKRLESELRTVELGSEGIKQFQDFINHMQAVTPNDKGNREIGYTIQKTKKKKVRFSVNNIEEVLVHDQTFDIFKGFRVTTEGSVSISRDLDAERFDKDSPPMVFLGCIIKTFDQQVGRVLIPLEENNVVTFWQPRSKRFILGCSVDKDGRPKYLK